MWHAFSRSIGGSLVYDIFIVLSGIEVLLKDKLISISSHICDEQEYEKNTEYKRCPHGELDGTRENALVV